jgi:hypothetical protein
MNSRILIALLSIVCGISRLDAAPITLVLPSGYTPGVPFKFSVLIPTVTNLGSYNIDVLMSGDVGIAGTDFLFDIGGTNAAASGYVFPSADFFFAATNLDSVTTARVTLTDLDLTGVDVTEGVNNSIAQVQVSTAPGYTGILSFVIDTDFLILDTPDPIPTSVAEFAAIQANTISAGPVNVRVVPEPGAFLGLMVVGLMAAIRRRRRSGTR